MARFIKVAVLLCVAALLLGALTFQLGTAKAATAGTCAWNVVASPNGSNGGSGLSGVAAISASDVWAVGSSGSQVSGQVTVAEHWNGTAWTLVTSPNPGSATNSLYAASAASSGNVWAVGYYANPDGVTHTLIEHWNGTAWSVVTSPSPGSVNNELFSVVAVSSNDVWAVGFTASNTSAEKTLIEHWNGTAWSVVKSPSPGTSPVNDVLSSVAAVSATDVWAVGSGGSTSQTLAEHWNGTKWSVVTTPNPDQGGVFQGVSAVSSSDVWAVGYLVNNGNIQTLIENWNGTSWQVVTSPSPGMHPSLWAVTAISATNVWAVGSNGSSTVFDKALTEHWNGKQWNVVKSPSPGATSTQLVAVSAVSAHNVWATGHADNNTLTENYHC